MCLLICVLCSLTGPGFVLLQTPAHGGIERERGAREGRREVPGRREGRREDRTQIYLCHTSKGPNVLIKQ